MCQNHTLLLRLLKVKQSTASHRNSLNTDYKNNLKKAQQLPELDTAVNITQTGTKHLLGNNLCNDTIKIPMFHVFWDLTKFKFGAFEVGGLLTSS